MLHRPAFYVWTLAGPVLTGILVTAVLVTPPFQDSLGPAIIASAVLGLLGAIPLSVYIESAIK